MIVFSGILLDRNRRFKPHIHNKTLVEVPQIVTPLLSRQCRTWTTFTEGKFRSVTPSFSSHLLSQVLAIDYHLKMIVYVSLSKFSGKLHSLELLNEFQTSYCLIQGPQKVFGIRNFPYLNLGNRDYKKNRARFGIESITGGRMWKNNPRDYGIARNFGSGLRDWRTVLGTPDMYHWKWRTMR